MSPGWYSQPFPPDGCITAEGLRNQLGRPELSLATVLVRESAQNSWDARLDGDVDYLVDAGEIGPMNMNAWRTTLGREMPTGPAEAFPLKKVLRNSSFRYLSVSDRGTSGLGGPTRSDVPAGPGERDWLSFVLNSGEARDSSGGGGTYGYGKGVFYLSSQVGAVVIHSRFREADRFVSRLIGAVLWASYTHIETPFTGRHWWGEPRDGYCEPLVDKAADELARSLGLRGFEGDETGTTVFMVDPGFPDPTLPDDEAATMAAGDAATFIAEAAGWNLWPLMMEGRRQRLKVRVTLDGAELAVPQESNDATIQAFTQAYRAMASEQGEEVICGRPRRMLGRSGMTKTFGARTDSHAARDLGVDGAPHHVALMRDPDLVVKYLPGPETAHPAIGYAGVMKTAVGLDDIFAKAEPPTHDAWIANQLSGVEATFVRMALRRMQELMAATAGSRRTLTTTQERPVGSVARRLGHLLGSSISAGTGAANLLTGARPAAPARIPGPSTPQNPASASSPDPGKERFTNPTPGEPASRNARPRARLEGGPVFVAANGMTVLEQRVIFSAAGTFIASTRVIFGDGRSETDPYAGADVPIVLGWRREDGNITPGDRWVTDAPGEAVLVVKPVADAAMAISVEGAA